MMSLRLAAKAIITYLMIQMLYTADSGIFALGVFLCYFFGNGTRPCQPSVDLFLFLGTAMASKHIQSLPEPHEQRFDAHILSLAGLYLVAGDKLRVFLLGVWLPYFYIGTDRGKCGAYISLAAAVPVFPYLRRAYQVFWPSVSALLYNSIKLASSRLCIYTIKAIEAVTPCLAPPSHLPPPPTLSLSAVITTAEVAPLEEPKAAMVDSSAQTEPLAKTDSSTQWEEDWVVKPVCPPKREIRYIVVGNGIIGVSANVGKLPTKRFEPSRIRKHRLQSPTPVLSPPTSPPTSPPSSVKPVTSVESAPVSPPTHPTKPAKSVRFADVSPSASPALLSGSPTRSSSAVVDQNPVSPSLPSSSRPVLALASTSPDVSAVPTPVLALASPDSIPEPTPAPVIVAAQTLIPEPSALAVECVPVSTPASCITTQSTPPLSTVSTPSVSSPTLISDHLSPALVAPPSPMSATISVQVSPVLRPSPTPDSAPVPGIITPLLPSPVILPAVAVVPVSVPEVEPKPNVEPEAISFSHVIQAAPALSTTSHPGPLIIAPADQMEMDFENIDQGSFPLPVDNLGDVQMEETIREDVRTTAGSDIDMEMEADVDGRSEVVLRDEGINIPFDGTFAATYGNSPDLSAPPTNTEVENFLSGAAGDIPLIETVPSVHVRDIFDPPTGQRMDIDSAASDHDDEMMVDVPCVPAPESPEFVMSEREDIEEIEDEGSEESEDKDIEESEDEESEESEDEESEESEDEGGDGIEDEWDDPILLDSPLQCWANSPTYDSMAIDGDNRMVDNASASDMSEPPSPLPPTLFSSPAQTSTTAPSTPSSAVDDRMSKSPDVGNCPRALVRSPSTVPSPNSTPLVPTTDNADMENQFGEGSTGFPSSSGLTSISASAAGSIAVPASLPTPPMLIPTVPVSGSAVASPAMSLAPTIPVSPTRSVLTAVSISSRLPPRPRPVAPPIEFIMVPNPATPKLDSRFIITNTPKLPTYNILALQPDYRPIRPLSAVPRKKEVYVEEFAEGGYRQKVPWRIRGLPCVDEEGLSQLEQRMNEAANKVKHDWRSRQAGIKEQTALDLAEKKQETQEIMDAKHEAARIEASQRRPKPAKPQGESCLRPLNTGRRTRT